MALHHSKYWKSGPSIPLQKIIKDPFKEQPKQNSGCEPDRGLSAAELCCFCFQATAPGSWLRVKHQERWWWALMGNGESMNRNSMSEFHGIFQKQSRKNWSLDRLHPVYESLWYLIAIRFQKRLQSTPQNSRWRTDASRSQKWPVEHPVEPYWYWIGWSRHHWCWLNFTRTLL